MITAKVNKNSSVNFIPPNFATEKCVQILCIVKSEDIAENIIDRNINPQQ